MGQKTAAEGLTSGTRDVCYWSSCEAGCDLDTFAAPDGLVFDAHSEGCLTNEILC